MVAYIIGFILLIIVIIITGLILRKQVYDTVDRLENWKMDITNRNTASQLARIKSLNLTGETQEKFETWKERWEYIVTKKLPDIEEDLFDAEEAADRYRFPKSKKTLQLAEEKLHTIEDNLKNMLGELDELLDSEKMSREEIEQIRPTIKQLRTYLAQHRFQYGESSARLENELDEMDEQLRIYDQLVEAGNYFEAKKAADDLKSQLEAFQNEMNALPDIYKKCAKHLPDELDDLMKGIQEMKNDGYQVDHLGFEKEIQDYKSRLEDGVRAIEKKGLTEAEAIISEAEERISEMYAALEKEAIAKNYVETQMPKYTNELTDLEKQFEETKGEVEELKTTYYFEDGDMEQYLSLEKTINVLKNQLKEVSKSVEDEDTSHSYIREQLEDGFKQMEELKESHQQFKNEIQHLRSDEVEAKEQVLEMKKQIQAASRKLKKSNIPGVPSYIWNLMEEAIQKNKTVLDMLDKKPLNMPAVQQALDDAQTKIDHFTQETDHTMEQAYLTEQVIQYTNRYRSQYPMLARKLMESERLFRSCEYELALEKSAETLEEIEPGALKRIEAYKEDESQFA